MSEIQAEYMTKMDVKPKIYNCKICEAPLGSLMVKNCNGKKIHYLMRWGDMVYHADIRCSSCGTITEWSINADAYNALMTGRLTDN